MNYLFLKAATSLAEALIFIGIFLIAYYQDLFLKKSMAYISTFKPVFVKVIRQEEQEHDMF